MPKSGLIKPIVGALSQALTDGKRWLTDYASINLDGADVQIQQATQRGLGRNEIGVGEIVGCLDRNGRQRSGKVLRLNDKTVTLAVGDQQ